MSRVAYVNGRYVPHRAAAVHIEDRGYQFGDGIYEVCTVRDGVPMEERGHLDRLERSLREMRIDMPMSRAAFSLAMRETIRRNLDQRHRLSAGHARRFPARSRFPDQENPPGGRHDRAQRQGASRRLAR